MKPTEAVEVLRQLPQYISATPGDHANIQLALATLESLAKAAEAKNSRKSKSSSTRKR